MGSFLLGVACRTTGLLSEHDGEARCSNVPTGTEPFAACLAAHYDVIFLSKPCRSNAFRWRKTWRCM